MEEFTHNCDDDLLGFFAVFFESVTEGFEQGIEDSCRHCGHEEPAPQMHRSDLGYRGLCSTRITTLGVLQGEAGPSGKLRGIFKFGEIRKLGNDDLTGDIPDAWNGFESLGSAEFLRV